MPNLGPLTAAIFALAAIAGAAIAAPPATKPAPATAPASARQVAPAAKTAILQPAAGTVIATVPVADGPGLVAAAGTHLFVTTETLAHPPRLLVFDISRPTRPTQVGAVQLHYWAKAFSLSPDGNYAYLGTAGVGDPAAGSFEIVDVRDPVHPVLAGHVDGLIGQYETSYVIPSLPGRALVYDGRVHIFAVNDPAHPVERGAVTTAGGVFAGAQDSFIVAAHSAASTGGLDLFDVSNPAAPRLADTLFSPVEPVSIVAAGQYVYATYQSGDLQILDGKSVPNAFSQVADFHTALPYARIMTVSSDGYVFLASTDGDIFKVIDVRNPAAPVAGPTLEIGGGGHFEFGVVVGDNAYVATADTGQLRVIRMR